MSATVIDPKAPTLPEVSVMAIENTPGVGSSPPAPSSIIPRAVTAKEAGSAPENTTGAEAVNVNTGPPPPVQSNPEVTESTIGDVNVIGVPTPMAGEKSPTAAVPNANGIDTDVASVGSGLSRIPAPPKATPPVIGIACAVKVEIPARLARRSSLKFLFIS